MRPLDPIEHIEAPDIDFPPDYRHYLVYVDESGIHGKTPYYGWGTLWIPAERRGDLADILREFKRQYRFKGEVKWSKMKGKGSNLACALIDQFFKRQWMMFHAMLVPRSEIRLDLFNGSITEARLRHLSTLLRTKVKFFGGQHPRKTYHIRVDPLPSPYKREHEKMQNITNALLKKTVGNPKITSMTVVDSKHRAGVQFADLLLGAVLSPWNGASKPDSEKARVSKHLFSRIGWNDHLGGTYTREWKFNLWWLTEAGKPRHVNARPCVFHFPTKPYRRPSRHS